MEGSNAGIIRNALEAWNRRDLETVAKLLHPDFEWVEIEESPAHAGAPRVGASAVERVTEDLDDGFAGYSVDIVEIVEIDAERAVVVMRETGRGKASGAPIVTEFGYLMTVTDGKAKRVEVYRRPADAFAAAGQSVGSGG